MTSLNISLPDPLKAYVEDRVASGDFGTPSEFVRNLIRQDKEQRRAMLETELIEALQGEDYVITPDELKGRTLVSVLREKLASRDRIAHLRGRRPLDHRAGGLLSSGFGSRLGPAVGASRGSGGELLAELAGARNSMPFSGRRLSRDCDGYSFPAFQNTWSSIVTGPRNKRFLLFRCCTALGIWRPSWTRRRSSGRSARLSHSI